MGTLMYRHNMKINGLKYIHLLFEFKQTAFFTSHGGYLLIIIIIILNNNNNNNNNDNFITYNAQIRICICSMPVTEIG